MCDYELVHGLQPMASRNGWKEHDWKLAAVYPEEACGWTSRDGRDGEKIFVSHANAHHKVTSAEKDFSNQVGTMTPPMDMDTRQPLSSATAGISQWAHEP